MPTTQSVCGDIPEPLVPDMGSGTPPSVIRDCESPALPDVECPSAAFTIDYNPDGDQKFTVDAGIFDSNCGELLDSLNRPISGIH